MVTFVAFSLLLDLLLPVVCSLSSLFSDLQQQCSYLASCKEDYKDDSGALCASPSSNCSCASNICMRINSSCVHSCNEKELRACMYCLQNAPCLLCSTQCARVCVVPNCENSQNDKVCQSCVSGYYGQNCNTSCSTMCQGSCFKETGYCETCETHMYGRECEDRCPDMCSACSSQNGSCLMCLDGYFGNNCEMACPSGFYGAGCSVMCPENCENRNCENTKGHCTEGCRPGFFGRLCRKKCPVGTYGSNCVSECPVTCAGNKSCNHINGLCENGCRAGFHGNHCSVLCSVGKYGDNCSQNCSQNCVLEVCNRFSGHCHTCIQGRDGAFCQDGTGVQPGRLSGYQDQSISTDETILIFMALFSLGGSSWLLLGACIYYKQKRIREKIERTGRLPRSWNSVINRHPQFFIYSGLRRRSSFLWRAPNRRLGMRIRRQRHRNAKRRDEFRLKILQKSNVEHIEVLENCAKDVTRMTLHKNQLKDERPNVDNTGLTSLDTGRGEAVYSEDKVREPLTGVDSLQDSAQVSNLSRVSLNTYNATNNETMNTSSKEQFGGKIDKYETECAEVTDRLSTMSTHESNTTTTHKLMLENKEMFPNSLGRTDKSQASVVVGLTANLDKPLDKNGVTTTSEKQSALKAKASDENGCQNTRHEDTILVNTPGQDKTPLNTAIRETSHCILDDSNITQDKSDLNNKHLNVADKETRITDCAYKGNITLNTAACHSYPPNVGRQATDTEFVQKRLTDFARGEPSCSDTITKEIWSTLTEEEERAPLAHQLARPYHGNATTSVCTNCGKQCICSLQECQGSTITTATHEQGDTFVPALRIGEIFQSSDTVSRHKRPTVLLREGSYMKRSSSTVKIAEEFSREAKHVQDRNTVNLLHPTTRNKLLRYQSKSHSKKTHGRHEHSSENVQEVTSTTFHTEAEASEATTSLSGSSTARSSKKRSASSTGEGTYSRQSGSASSTVVSSSAISTTGTSSLDTPSQRLHSRNRQQFRQAASERQSQPTVAKTYEQKKCGFYDFYSSQGHDNDLENNEFFERNSPRLNMFQRGYKHLVNAVNKMLKPNRPAERILYGTAHEMSSPLRPSSGEFLISRLEAWRKSRNLNRETGVDARELNKTKHTQSPTTAANYPLGRSAGHLSESTSTVGNTLGTTSQTKGESSATEQSDVWLSKSASSRAVSASTFSRGTRYSASAGISASTSSSSSHYSTSAASISSSEPETMTTERDEQRTDIDSLSAVTKSTIRYPCPYVSKYIPESSTRRHADPPHHGRRQNSILSRADFSKKNVGDPRQRRLRPSLHY